MDQGYAVRFLGSAEGPFKLCAHKITVKLGSIGGSLYSCHIQLFKGMEQTENCKQEQSFTRRKSEQGR